MTEITAQPEVIDWLHTTYVNKSVRAAIVPPPLSIVYNESDIAALIKKACKHSTKFASLFAGDINSYPSHSEADQAFSNLISYYTSDHLTIDGVFRKSKLYREKWDEVHFANGDTYGEATIATALASLSAAAGNGARSGFAASLNKATDKPITYLTNIVSLSGFVSECAAPFYIWHRVLQVRNVYALTAAWGGGKTALMILIALFAATGRELSGRGMIRVKVLFLCGENPDDVKLRTLAAAEKLDIDLSELDGQIYFTRRPFAIDDSVALTAFLTEAADHGPFGLAFVDTGPAHSGCDDENDNKQMHALAMALRELLEPLGGPALVVAMHPTKSATKETMQPRGGGAFSGSIDGELCVWNSNGVIEFYHRTKFRGAGFEPMFFRLEKHTFPELLDNFGEAAISVVAVPTEGKPSSKKGLKGANQVALNALDACWEDGELSKCGTVHEDAWRNRCYVMGISNGEQSAKAMAFRRCRDALLEMGLVNCSGDYYSNSTWLIKIDEGFKE
ncbi:MAG: AAA family ATPase [Burkholderiaceae bacterium]|nr:AAA family ATPase [Burkholderiaceae bacterium]